MHGDFSRLVFRPDRHFSAVLAQQGRVQLDSDANEQALLHLHLTRTLARDLVGPHGGPRGAAGFGLRYQAKGREPANLEISPGRYYVDGILLDATRPVPGSPVPDGQSQDDRSQGDPGEPTAPASAPAAVPAPRGWTYWDQPDAYRDRENDLDHLPDPPFLAYLRVWETLVTAVQDPAIRESALGVTLPDTTVRARVAWQVLPLSTKDGFDPGREVNPDQLRAAFDRWVAGARPTAQLAARTDEPPSSEEPCLVAPESRYRGPENQLYRVEVHRGGRVGDQRPPTFTWSRENGSVVFGVRSVAGAWVTLTTLGRDGKLGLDVGDWVEVLDDASAARGVASPLLRVEDVDTEASRVRLSGEPPAGVGRTAARHPFLRRWDHQATGVRGAPQADEGALRVQEGSWIDLEDGVQVWFAKGGSYRTGDYWLIPARTLTGEVEWPRDARGRALLQDPHGVRIHYAPLAWVRGPDQVDDLRRQFPPLAT
ncbi:hypothetical protein LX15_002839 [Streptoalloteichus tenebrarius]|uniref:Uncharacterized protein n=1 Tax=Streptoalloteichus tenebrarius (strain ATCC 17920 / DSM 40477 / JCM 4838 / CBS 697.72 / NBRC 16177 / NCIMB 11028 / NRRL B-12390 / A12253. 1 / ISP 5477) TaxID=1933 RepID=A0ABT1HUD4_STRSD|nr:DUF6519 domain-containing protein [Streptoalloteichus tenebrarius]MCP2259138.1 hypothetical protein [Streptoalloteichus tenebrarius]BFF04386.1 hypothetical protein GCM10020241_60610 [Streptoalloteichus tenebrarius]